MSKGLGSKSKGWYAYCGRLFAWGMYLLILRFSRQHSRYLPYCCYFEKWIVEEKMSRLAESRTNQIPAADYESVSCRERLVVRPERARATHAADLLWYMLSCDGLFTRAALTSMTADPAKCSSALLDVC